jgi:hypothetical protein
MPPITKLSSGISSSGQTFIQRRKAQNSSRWRYGSLIELIRREEGDVKARGTSLRGLDQVCRDCLKANMALRR